MQVKVEDVSTVKKILHVEIPEEEVSKKLDTAYTDLRKTAKIKGFRPGKAPRAILERLYKKDIHADVASKLVQESFADAIKETNLKILVMPQFDPPQLESKSSFQYQVAVEVTPTIEEIDFKGLKLKKNRYQVSDGEIEAQLKMLQQNVAQYNPIPEVRPVIDGDFVLLDYEGFVNGQPFDQTRKTENYLMKIGAAKISADFDKELIGMKEGEHKEIRVKFPENYPNPSLSNLEVNFHIMLKGIRQEVLPEINDEFVKQFGNYSTLDDLKAAIHKTLAQGYDKRVEQELNEQIFLQLIEKTNFETPEVLVKHELEGIIQEAEAHYAYHNIPLDEIGMTREKMTENFMDTAAQQVKRHMILSQIMEQEKLVLSDEELEAGLRVMAITVRKPYESVKQYYSENQDKLEGLKHTLLEKKAMKLVLENSVIEEVEPDTTTEKEKVDNI